MSLLEETGHGREQAGEAVAAANPDQQAESAKPGTGRGRRRRRTVLLVAALAVVATAATMAALGVFGGSAGGTTAAPLPPATAEVTRATMVQAESFDGTLDYGETLTFSAADASGQTGGGAGVITWRPGVGETITRGEPVYSVNAEPVVLMYGKLPFFREIGVGDSGADVAQLEENLAELGYQGFTVDDEFTWSTAEAVRQWQEDLDLAATGRFDPSRVVVAGGETRVAEHLAALGAAASGPVLSYTGTARVVTVTMEVSEQRYAAEDLAVTVTLPDDSAVEGTISQVGTVATSSESEQQGPGADSSATIEVLITVADEEALGDWDAAPVKVAIEVDRREDVLAVPIGALVALAEGGYGVQVVDEAGSRYVAVDTGMFADGLVEISGEGLTEGVTVGVPS